jgi:tRNA dimethylallyltransferase
MSEVRPLLICVVGPTAVGKTWLGIRLARALGAEILSADSRQIYRSMSIGTAAPTALEREQAPHHFVEFLDPSETYSAGDFEKDAIAFLDTYFKTHPVAILVGGSGLYVKGVIKGFDFLPSDLELREKLNGRAESEGVAVLAEELLALDPVHHAKMDLSNPQRVVRALEVCLCSGKPFSSFHSAGAKSRNFDIVQVGLKADKDALNSRIERRTAQMMEAGWLEEVKALMEYKDCNALA